MISKERLEELIEQGATIYSNEYGEIQLKKEDDLSLYENGQNNYILYALEPNKKYHNEIFDEDLFETEEEAKWFAEFGCIERTERLELPTWEELQNKREFYLGFNNKEGIVRYYLAIYMPYQKDYGAILISYSDANNDTIICFDKIATKENYTIACKKAKELFLKGNVND